MLIIAVIFQYGVGLFVGEITEYILLNRNDWVYLVNVGKIEDF
jgi:hypothetical protein